MDGLLAVGGITAALASGDYAGAALGAVGLTKEVIAEERKRRTAAWFKGLVESGTWETAQEVQGLIEARIRGSKKAQETVYAAAREIIDAVSDEAVEAIGSLTAEYLKGDLGPDPFFRGAVRVLADLSGADLELFRQMLILATAEEYDGRYAHLTISQNGLEASSEHGGQSLIDPKMKGREREVIRVFRLLNANDLGSESPDGQLYADGISSGKTYIEKNDLTRLALHLGVPKASISERP